MQFHTDIPSFPSNLCRPTFLSRVTTVLRGVVSFSIKSHMKHNVLSESFRIRNLTAAQSLSVKTVSRVEEVVDTTITTVVEGTNSKEFPASLPRKDVNYTLETWHGKLDGKISRITSANVAMSIVPKSSRVVMVGRRVSASSDIILPKMPRMQFNNLMVLSTWAGLWRFV